MRTLAELICAAAGRLCRQLWLLAGVILLCTVLPVLAGRGAQQLLSQGVSFSGITLAVTAPEGDGTPQLLQGQCTICQCFSDVVLILRDTRHNQIITGTYTSGRCTIVSLQGCRPVCHDHTGIVPFITHYARAQIVIIRGMNTVDQIIACHDRTGVRLPDCDLKAPEIDLTQRTL